MASRRKQPELLSANAQIDSEYAKFCSLPIGSEIGSGGFGRVIKVDNNSVRKVLNTDPNLEYLLTNELRVCSSLMAVEHKNLVKVTEVDQKERTITMKWAGATLRHILAEDISIDKHLISTLLFDLASAVKKLNELGYIHRDIALRNIFVRNKSDGLAEFVLGDFGTCSNNPYKTGLAVVTSNNPPEHTFGWKSDVFSIGKVCWDIMIQIMKPWDSKERVHEVMETFFENYYRLVLRMVDPSPLYRPDIDSVLWGVQELFETEECKPAKRVRGKKPT